MAASSQPRQDGHSRSVLGELSVGNIQNIKPAIESLAQNLDSLHIHSPVRKENICESLVSSCEGIKPHPALAANPGQAASATPNTRQSRSGTSYASSDTSTNIIKHSSQEDFESNNPLALASQQLPSTQEQLWKHQEGQFEWLLSVPVNTSAKERRSLGDSRDDTELAPGRKEAVFRMQPPPPQDTVRRVTWKIPQTS
ncbi:hypothetical protein MMYC01_208247 [Madurella mycetomatis]|uniref:Uncharacterized protein n=1 Tax=Madurella mycetomatis TaxID=100816 RepID=A0A175VRZ7_9PEZI|nr:hypothetical protein MMYC01_208247 [Madurella mycetomatis]